MRCREGKGSENLATYAAQSKSSAQTYLLFFICVRKLGGSMRRWTDLYDYWNGGKQRHLKRKADEEGIRRKWQLRLWCGRQE